MSASRLARIVSLTGLVGVLVLLAAMPVCAEPKQNQTPPPPPPPSQGQSDPGQASRGRSQEPGLYLGRRRTNRPYRGLFGGGVGETEQLLTLSLNGGVGYDSSVYVNTAEQLRDNDSGLVDDDSGLVDNDNGLDPNAPVQTAQRGRDHSTFNAGSAIVSYTLNRSSFSLWSSGGIGFSYYPVLVDPFMRRYHADAGASWSISPKTSLSGGYALFFGPVQHLVTQPNGGIDPMLGPTDPFGNTLGGEGESYRSENAYADLGYQLSRRINVSGRYAMWRSVSPTHIYDQDSHDVGGRVSFSLTRDVYVYTGYRFTTQRFGGGLERSPFHTNNIDAGLGFAKALSLTRHTYLSFGSGTSAVSDGNDTKFWITGNVALTREIGRTWAASARYSRDAQFVETFLQPVFSDTATAAISGLLSRRVEFNADAYLTYGKVGFNGPSNGYRTFYATSGIGIAITRYLSGGVRYVYARYSFDQGVLLPRDLRFATDRHGVSGYLSAWLPLYQRARRP